MTNTGRNDGIRLIFTLGMLPKALFPLASANIPPLGVYGLRYCYSLKVSVTIVEFGLKDFIYMG